VNVHAQEFQPNGIFRPVEYIFEGSEQNGWKVIRKENEKEEKYLSIGPGYCLVESSFCGICTTDLSRQHLPFPLPQITGNVIETKLY
jgi:hypothetical protein